jgi:hypothetical protein
MVTNPINRRQDAKIHTSIIAQNLHRPNKHHHLLLPALSFSPTQLKAMMRDDILIAFFYK